MKKPPQKSAAQPPLLLSLFPHGTPFYVEPTFSQEQLILGTVGAKPPEGEIVAAADRIEGYLRDTYGLFRVGFSISDLHTVEQVLAGEWIKPDPLPSRTVTGWAMRVLLDKKLITLLTEVPVCLTTSSDQPETIRAAGEVALSRCTHYLYPRAGLLDDESLIKVSPDGWPWMGLRDVGVTARPRYYPIGGLLCAKGEKLPVPERATVVRTILGCFEQAGWPDRPVPVRGVELGSKERKKVMQAFLGAFPIEIRTNGRTHMYWQWRDVADSDDSGK